MSLERDYMKRRLREILEELDDAHSDLPDGAYWALANERLGFPGDSMAQAIVAGSPKYFGYTYPAKEPAAPLGRVKARRTPSPEHPVEQP